MIKLFCTQNPNLRVDYDYVEKWSNFNLVVLIVLRNNRYVS